jgi:hypothetical protein
MVNKTYKKRYNKKKYGGNIEQQEEQRTNNMSLRQMPQEQSFIVEQPQPQPQQQQQFREALNNTGNNLKVISQDTSRQAAQIGLNAAADKLASGTPKEAISAAVNAASMSVGEQIQGHLTDAVTKLTHPDTINTATKTIGSALGNLFGTKQEGGKRKYKKHRKSHRKSHNKSRRKSRRKSHSKTHRK